MQTKTVAELAKSIKTDFKRVAEIANSLVAVAVEKDKAYGSSWCSRGGQGAFFQGVVRKWDRLETQLTKVSYDMFNLEVAEDTSESLDETLRDLCNYCLLVLEKREALRAHLNVLALSENLLRETGLVACATGLPTADDQASATGLSVATAGPSPEDDPLPMSYAIGITNSSDGLTRGPVPDIA